MMVVVLGDEVAEVHDGHGLLETRMERGPGMFGGSHSGDSFHNGETGRAEILQDIGNGAVVMGRLVGFTIFKVGGVQSGGAAGVIVEALVP